MSRRFVLVAGCLILVLVAAVWFRGRAASETTGAGGSAVQAQPVSRPSSHPLDQFNTAGLAIPREHILSGGPGKDGIPALSRPKTAPLAKARFPRDSDRVVVVSIAKQVRAYPVSY